MNIRIFLQTLVILSNLAQTEALPEEVEYCRNKVYCSVGGNLSLLEMVVRRGLFAQSKRFVNLAQINDEYLTSRDFKQLMHIKANEPNQIDMEHFVMKRFFRHNELVFWMPPDFTEQPPFLTEVYDITLVRYSKALVKTWASLARRVDSHVLTHPNRHSLRAMRNGFIIPGDKHTEPIYWDTYFIVRGLLVCDMIKTVKGILDNFVFVNHFNEDSPQRPRKYYAHRAHPPLLIAMVALYIEHTNDTKWLKTNIRTLSNEMVWWQTYRIRMIDIKGETYVVPQWGPNSSLPRANSFLQDEFLCRRYEEITEKEQCIGNLMGAEESGWYLSSRWTMFNVSYTGNETTKMVLPEPKRVIPVDLTGILCQAFTLLSKFYTILQDRSNAEKWSEFANNMRRTVELLYSKEDGIWYDFNIELQEQRQIFYAINFTPLWTECYDLKERNAYGRRAANYFTKQGLDFYWGVPASLFRSGNRWDFPNAFPPMQELVIFGLQKTGNAKAKQVATKLANRWMISNVKAWFADGSIYDRYDATRSGKSGLRPGKHDASDQMGYAWTVGVALTFIDQYACHPLSSISTTIINYFFYTIGYSSLIIMGILLKML